MSTSPYGGTVMSSFSFQQRGKRWQDQKFNTPQFSIDVVNNNPRFTTWQNHPDEADKTASDGMPLKNKPISARMRWTDLVKIITLINLVLDSSEPMFFTADFKAPKYENGEKVKGEFIVTSRFQFGKSPDGKVYMKHYQKDREKAVFDFGENFWVPIKINQEKPDEKMGSFLGAKGFWGSIDRLVGPAAVAYFVPEQAKKPTPTKPIKQEEELVEVDISSASSDEW